MMKQPGLYGRHRDQDGQIRHDRRDALGATLRHEYGDDFAEGYRSAPLRTSRLRT